MNISGSYKSLVNSPNITTFKRTITKTTTITQLQELKGIRDNSKIIVGDCNKHFAGINKQI